jgi:nitronate monooxygenase
LIYTDHLKFGYIMREMYREELNRGDEGYGVNGRLTTYAGTGVGLIREVITTGTL